MKNLVELTEERLHVGRKRARRINALQRLTDRIGQPRRRDDIVAALRVVAEGIPVTHGVTNDPNAKMLHEIDVQGVGRP